jgi:trk system potassium uptake protein TrkH
MVLFASSIIVIIALGLNSEYGSSIETIRHSLFQTVSIATTTGYTSQSFSSWPAAIPVFLIMMSFIGACVGSTGGGIKVIRILVMFRLGMKEIHKFIRPNAQVSVKLNGGSINEKALVFCAWLLFTLCDYFFPYFDATHVCWLRSGYSVFCNRSDNE